MNVQQAVSRKTKYAQVQGYLVDMIRTGEYSPGELLPSEKQLASSMSIARNTVRQALGELESQGVVTKVHGRGSFVSEQAIERLGQNNRKMFALLVDELDGFYLSLQKGFCSAAAELSNKILVCESDNNIYKQADEIIQLVEKNVSGVAIVPVTSRASSEHQIRLLQNNNIPVVFCHRRPDGVRAPLLAIPFEKIGFSASQHLLDRGHNRIAFISRLDRSVSGVYEKGFHDAMAQYRVTLPEDFVRFGESSDKPNSDEFLQNTLKCLFDRPENERPTAIVSTFDLEAERIFFKLMNMGIRVPEDVSLVGFGGQLRHSAFLESLTSIIVDEEHVGEQAVDLLCELSDGRKRLDSDEVIQIPIKLYEGETVRSLE